DFAERAMAREKELCPGGIGHPGSQRSRYQEADQEVRPDARDVHEVVVADGGEGARRNQAAQERALSDGHVHRPVAFHPAPEALLGLGAGLLDQSRSEGETKDEGQDNDHDHAPAQLADQELPPQKDEKNQAQLEAGLVEGNSKITGLAKVAPFLNRERATATEAYEHDDDAAPRALASAAERTESWPRALTMARLEGTAATTADSTKPSESGQRTCQNMSKAKRRARPRLSRRKPRSIPRGQGLGCG